MNLDEWLSASGAPAISWKDRPIGYTVTGVICAEPTVQQQRDYDTGEPEFWDDNKTRPIMILVVPIRTDMRDPTRPDDDGERRIFFQGRSLTDGIREQARKAGGLAIGGRLTVAYIGEGEQPNKRFKAPKLFRVTYEPPDAVAEFLRGDGGGATVATTATGKPLEVREVASIVPTTASATMAIPAGVDPNAWARLDDTTRAQVLAGLGRAADTPPF